MGRLTYHIILPVKYRYKVLKGEGCRELLIQVCNAEEIGIFKGVDQFGPRSYACGIYCETERKYKSQTFEGARFAQTLDGVSKTERSL